MVGGRRMTHLRVIEGGRGLCTHCGKDHPDAAHHDPLVALEVADRYLYRGDPGEARVWVAVARTMLRRKR